ncbi:kinase-like protein [Artomyces pyxidatus]|uniref:Kinase-like protein n=1 Tax=Artomyces pyxidatus TaxID=48021 RepID=A0ACB8TCK2_9AGAM|nr:kinase-like protein [Artomyces pyxidatus]
MFKVRFFSIFKKVSKRKISTSPQSSSSESEFETSDTMSIASPRTPSNRSPWADAVSRKELEALALMFDAHNDTSVLDVRRSIDMRATFLHMAAEAWFDEKFASESSHSFGPLSVELPSSPPTSPIFSLIGCPGITPVFQEPLLSSHPQRAVKPEDFVPVTVLGEGASGKVYLVQDKVTDEKLALKVIRKREHTVDQIINEQRVLKKISGNDWFLSLEASTHDDKNFYLATKYFPTDLQSELRRCNGKFDKERSRFYAAEIVVALEALHRSGVIHRDIKPANILLTSSGHIVLADFGMAKSFAHRLSSSSKVENDVVPHFSELLQGNQQANPPAPPHRPYPRGPDDVTHSKFGTLAYAAPEVKEGRKYTYGVDYWSLGVVLYIMLTGRFIPGEMDDDAASFLNTVCCHFKLSF